jgi:hypothetical protein
MSGQLRFPEKLALSLITWAERYADPAEREWIGAMRAELDAVDGGVAQLRWAAGALPLLWRPYRLDILLFVLCTAAVVLVNYSYPKIATARPIELFFFAQQFYLPLLALLAARSTHRVLAGTGTGVASSLLGFAVLHALGYGVPDASTLLSTGSPGIYVQILLFAIVGAAFGTLGATTVLRLSRRPPVPAS